MSDREKCCDSRRLFFGRPGVCGFVPILRVCTSAKHDCKARSGTVVLEREFYATMLNSAHADRHDTNKPAGHFLKCQPSCTHSCNSEPPACGHRLGLDRLENGWTWDMVVVLGGRWSLLLCCGCCCRCGVVVSAFRNWELDGRKEGRKEGMKAAPNSQLSVSVYLSVCLVCSTNDRQCSGKSESE